MPSKQAEFYAHKERIIPAIKHFQDRKFLSIRAAAHTYDLYYLIITHCFMFVLHMSILY